MTNIKVMKTAEVKGHVFAQESSVISYGVRVEGVKNSVKLGRYSMILENSLVQATDNFPVTVGQGTVFGHRCIVKGAKIGNFCEIGNGVVIDEGAELGDFVMIGEGAYIPKGSKVESKSVILGKPYKKLRDLTEEDLASIRNLRSIDLEIVEAEYTKVPEKERQDQVDNILTYKEHMPKVSNTITYGERAEIIGQVTIGEDTYIANDVKIIGDGHGTVTIGDNVHIGEHSVLHLLPGNDLKISNNVNIGARCIIHGCIIEDNVIVEDDCNICDLSVLEEGSTVKKNSLVAQRTIVKKGSIVEGYPVKADGCFM